MSNALVAGLWPVLAEATTAANTEALKIKAATSGKDDKIADILTTSDDAEIAKWRANDARIRAEVEKALAALEEAKSSAAKRAESLLTETDDYDVEKGKAEFLSKRQEVTSIKKTILLVLKNDQTAFDKGIEEHGIVEVLSLRGSGGATSGATGKRKPRLRSASVNGQNVEGATFTTLAAKIGVDVDALKSEAYKVAGTDDLQTVAGQTFSFTIANGKAETFNVEIVPAEKGEKRSSADTSESDDDDDENSESETSAA